MVACLVILLGGAAHAAKWHECPAPPFPIYPSVRGATTAPFIHPGHELTIVLNEDETAEGGFSVLPDENTVEITFHSVFGDDIELAARTATTSDPSVLKFPFPDGTQEAGIGRTLAGPVEVRVIANDEEVAHIASTDLVGLPPSNDVTPIILGEDPDRTVFATLGADGDVWVPARFQGDPMVMPGCPGGFIVPQPVQVAGAQIVGAPPTPNPLAHISQVDGYIGDVTVNDYSIYGMPLPIPIKLVHVQGTLGISICQLNDAIDVVIRVHGNASWAQPHSPFASVAESSTPIPLVVIASYPIPGNGQLDSLGSPCSRIP